MGYKLDNDYELFAIVMNKKPATCEDCPFFGRSIQGGSLGYCIPMDFRMWAERFTKGTLGACPIKTRMEMGENNG